MINQSIRVFFMMAAACVAVQVLAEDCATAVWNSGTTPVSTTTTQVDSKGKTSISRTVQTMTDKYIQTENGQWHSVSISMKDLIDDRKSTKVTCRRIGSDTVNGVPTITYDVREENEDATVEGKIWTSRENRVLKFEGGAEGVRFTTMYDYAHVTPPAGAMPLSSH